MSRQSIVLLGSTGSIGESVLQVVRENPKRFRISALAAGSDADKLLSQIEEFKPDAVALADEGAAERLASSLRPDGPQLFAGDDDLARLCKVAPCDRLINAVVGAAGLRSTIEAIGNVPRICLANKESLVAAGEIVMEGAAREKTEIIPIDSEHSALHQCLEGHPRDLVGQLILTASGGPFRKKTASEIAEVSVAEALAHPTWKMGPKISIDSATLMNKGLELIEAMYLFDFPVDQIGIVVHPQSVVHSMVEFRDGSLLAQLGETDMKHPIRYALTYPDRLREEASFHLAGAGTLTFEEPDYHRFPCLTLARDAARQGGTAPAVLNAANEVAVEAFLEETIPFNGIPTIIRETMDRLPTIPSPDLPRLVEADRDARREAADAVRRVGSECGTGKRERNS